MGRVDPCPTPTEGMDAGSVPFPASPHALYLEVSGHTWGLPDLSDQTCSGLGGICALSPGGWP